MIWAEKWGVALVEVALELGCGERLGNFGGAGREKPVLAWRSGTCSEDSEENCPQSLNRLINTLSSHALNTDRNVGRGGHSGEVADGNEAHGAGNQRKNCPCFKAAKNLTELVCVLALGG